MAVLIAESESEIFAIFLLYIFPNTRPAAFHMHGLMNVSPMLEGFFSLPCERFRMTLLLFLQRLAKAIFNFFRQSFLLRKRLKSYFYGHSAFSVDDAGTTWSHCAIAEIFIAYHALWYHLTIHCGIL